MNRIDQRFAELKAEGASAFVPFLVAGDPTLERSEEIAVALAQNGADVIELGVPFSDPIGDGAVIQESAQRALKHRVHLTQIFESARRIRQQTDCALLLFTYYNPLLAYGIERLAKAGADAGIDGVLCVDLPAEEAEDYRKTLSAHGLSTVFLVAPTTSDARLAVIAEQCTGFVYYVSRLGVTGERAELSTNLDSALARIRSFTDKPIAVGFGIGTPEQAEKVAGLAEGVVVGSAIVRLIGQLGDQPGTAQKVGAFAGALAEAAKRGKIPAG